MDTLVFALALLVTVVVSAVFYLKYRLNNTSDKKNLEAALDSQVKKLTRNDPSHGLVIGVYKNGSSFIKGYGKVNREGATAPDASTVFQIASVSKLFTTSLLQILCDEDVLRMEMTLGELLGNSITLSPAAQLVTLKQLATHTSGFASIPKPLARTATKLVSKASLMRDPYSHLGPEYLFDYLKTTKDKRPPGSFRYSNFGLGLLGHILEIVTKKNFESLIFEKLLAPLEMRDTAITLTPKMKAALAQGYTAKGEPSSLWTFRALAGAGAYHSTVEDMIKFVRANIEYDALISSTLKKMHMPLSPGISGIGWIQATFIDRFVGNKSVVWHNGMVGGYASYVSVDTEAKTGIVILSNKAVDVTMLGMMLTRLARTQSWAPQLC